MTSTGDKERLQSSIVNTAGALPSIVGAQLGRLIFVGGSPRSGTTLAQRILNYHPEIYGGPEFDFVPHIVELFQGMHRSIRSGRIDAILSEEALTEAFRGLLAALLFPKLEAEGARYLSEKTPSNVIAFPWLDTYVPEAKKIWVLRDPLDVVSSMLDVGRSQRHRKVRVSEFVRDVIVAVDYMNKCLKAGASIADTSGNCLVIYYEDMVADPLSMANQIYRFIGVTEIDEFDFANAPYLPARNLESYVGWSTPGTVSGGIDKQRIGMANKKLTRGQLDYIRASTFDHHLLSRYAMQPRRWTAAARWCLTGTMASHLKEIVRGMLSDTCRHFNKSRNSP